MINSWKNIPEFQDLVKDWVSLSGVLSEGDSESLQSFQDRKIKSFLTTSLAEHKKMFGRWLDSSRLAFLACFGECKLGKIVCQRILGFVPHDDERETDCHFYSSNHNRTFDLVKYGEFVSRYVPMGDVNVLHYYHVRYNMDIISAIAEGLDLSTLKLAEAWVRWPEKYGASASWDTRLRPKMSCFSSRP